jgi:hypothetical protein
MIVPSLKLKTLTLHHKNNIIKRYDANLIPHSNRNASFRTLIEHCILHDIKTTLKITWGHLGGKSSFGDH